MQKSTFLVLIVIFTCWSQILPGQPTPEKPDMTANASKIKTLMIEDFEEEGVLGRVGATEGITVSLTQEDAVSGQYALEITVAPFSQHKNLWPYVYFGHPKFLNPPLDLTHYSKISMTVKNVTDGLANIAVQGSTLPYNDAGRNFAHEGFLIPGGTSWVCDFPASRFVYAGTKEQDGQKILWNDPSNVQIIMLVFPPNEITAVYRIDAMQAVYDPAEGSCAEELQVKMEQARRQYVQLEQHIHWNNVPQDQRQAMRAKYENLGQKLETIDEAYRQGSAQGFQGRYIAIKRDLDEALREFGELVLADKQDYFVWQIDPYLNIYPDEAPTLENLEVTNLHVQMAENEFRDAVFMVSTCGKDLKLEVKCQMEENVPAEAIVVQETLYFKNTTGEEVGDAVYRLSEPLAIPAGQSRQIRLRFDSRYSGIKAGRYSFTVRLSDLNTGVIKDIPGKLEVWDFRLPSYDILAHNSYAEFDNCQFSTPELTAKAVAHMKMYGLNEVFIHPVEMPRTKVDAEGNLLGFDNTAFENRIRAIQKGWQSLPGDERLQYLLGALVINSFHLDRPDIDYTNKSKEATAKWKAIFPQWYANLKETTRRLGIADEDLIMVLHDEPSESWMINGVIPLAQAIKDVDPTAKINNNTSNIINDAENTQKFYKLIDIFQPHLPEFKKYPMLREWVQDSGKTIWTYKCLGGFNRKDKNPYEYYRVYGWDLVKYKLTGIGVWTYCAQGTNVWENPDGGAILIYKHPTSGEVVHARRYEMFREGVDDYRYVAKLREAAKAKGAAVLAEAERLIEEAVADVTSDVRDTSRCEKWRIRIAQEILKLQK